MPKSKKPQKLFFVRRQRAPPLPASSPSFGYKTTKNLGINFVPILCCSVFTGSIARSSKRWYLSDSEGDFEVFRPAKATRCADQGARERGKENEVGKEVGRAREGRNEGGEACKEWVEATPNFM